jgi:hypothetical protein
MVCCVPWFHSFTNFLAKGQVWEEETNVLLVPILQ